MKANNVNKNKYVNKGEEKNNKIMNKNEQRNGKEQFILDGIHEAHTHNYVHISNYSSQLLPLLLPQSTFKNTDHFFPTGKPPDASRASKMT